MASHCLRYVFHFNIVRSTKHFHILYINKLNYFRFFLFFSLIFILSCDSSKTYVLEGDKNLQGGHFDDAANYYYNALLIKKDNKEAKQGLKKAGQSVLDDKFSAFGKLVVENKAQEAVMQYKYNEKYYQNIKAVGVELNWPDMYHEVYEDIRDEYISKIYDQGLALMKLNKYDKAEEAFERIASIDSSYKNVSVLKLQSVLEPLYAEGNKQMRLENYKAAYRNFNKLLSYDEGYKDTKKMRDEALQKATVTLGVVLNNSVKYPGNEDKMLYEQCMASLVKSPGAFLKIIDRDNVEQLLKEQQQGMSGIIDPLTAAKAGKMIGLKYLLLIDPGELKMLDQKPETVKQAAYEAFDENLGRMQGTSQFVTRFRKVYYDETTQSHRVNGRVFYQLISIQTGQVLTSDVINSEKKDEQVLAKFNGDPRNLYLALPSGNFMPPADPVWRERFSEVKRELQSFEILYNDLFKEISNNIAIDVKAYVEK